MKGWKYESHRHMLASKGIKTLNSDKYFINKTAMGNIQVGSPGSPARLKQEHQEGRMQILKSRMGKVKVTPEELARLEEKYGEVSEVSTDEILSDLSEWREDGGAIWNEHEYNAEKSQSVAAWEMFALPESEFMKTSYAPQDHDSVVSSYFEPPEGNRLYSAKKDEFFAAKSGESHMERVYHENPSLYMDTMGNGLNMMQASKKNKSELKPREILVGGKGDGRPDFLFNKVQLKKGMKHESEHTNNKQIQKEIAKDHLTEDPKYYFKLDKMERK